MRERYFLYPATLCCSFFRWFFGFDFGAAAAAL
jgi:hypothetical protein